MDKVRVWLKTLLLNLDTSLRETGGEGAKQSEGEQTQSDQPDSPPPLTGAAKATGADESVPQPEAEGAFAAEDLGGGAEGIFGMTPELSAELVKAGQEEEAAGARYAAQLRAGLRAAVASKSRSYERG